jgi:hypothetical protein
MPLLRKIHLGAALLALPLLLAGCGASASEQGAFERTLTVSGPVRLELANGAGAVEIRAGEPGKVHIHAEVQVAGSAWTKSSPVPPSNRVATPSASARTPAPCATSRSVM